jgi:nitroreductase
VEFQDVIRKRRMIRTYDLSRPVPRAAIERLVDNAVRAPSAGFSQGWATARLTWEVCSSGVIAKSSSFTRRRSEGLLHFDTEAGRPETPMVVSGGP